ncbi:tail protein X [Campylobacter pinnipediorum]|uniref:tail protein X n=1 Tax=Campylobacter pinnipediorum TaxID=1965231 RepID=UPI000995A19D|nr:tail protein X [Campylobacter pinnipediorum]AQW83307.1 phage tail protein X family protein [Campylobacter pinnipediorum subsp. pinnipediorum]OPA75447.1 phage tail protein [Campylobacter pinnipediorum subsp. pinnipediorum]
MKIYIAKDGDRLDSVVQAYYGHLRFFKMVLELNTKLKYVLSAGDNVLLPEIKEEKKQTESALW